jgi:hypothetical protein
MPTSARSLCGELLDRLAARALGKPTVSLSLAPPSRLRFGRSPVAAPPSAGSRLGWTSIALPQELVSEPRAKYRPESCPLLVLVGRVIEEEGVEDIVRATALLATDFPVAVAAIVGTGHHLSGFGNWPTSAVRRSRSHARAGPDRFGAARHTCAGHRRARGPRGRDERGSGTPQPPPGFDAEVIGVEFGPEILRHAAGWWLH